MVIELKANLPDSPGTLIKMLKPISDNSGNISSVIHSHHEKRGDKIPVIVHFDLPEEFAEEKLKIIKEELTKLSIDIIEITHLLQRERITIIISGHVFETDFIDTFKRINNTGAKVVRIEAMFTEPTDISNVKFEILCDKDKIDKTLNVVRQISKEKNLTVIYDR